jgi:hypothetical protein
LFNAPWGEARLKVAPLHLACGELSTRGLKLMERLKGVE